MLSSTCILHTVILDVAVVRFEFYTVVKRSYSYETVSFLTRTSAAHLLAHGVWNGSPLDV